MGNSGWTRTGRQCTCQLGGCRLYPLKRAWVQAKMADPNAWLMNTFGIVTNGETVFVEGALDSLNTYAHVTHGSVYPPGYSRRGLGLRQTINRN
jgi:hypothetical protein